MDSAPSIDCYPDLGHATIGITLDTYSHVVGSLQREAADQLDELLG